MVKRTRFDAIDLSFNPVHRVLGLCQRMLQLEMKFRMDLEIEQPRFVDPWDSAFSVEHSHDRFDGSEPVVPKG